MLLPRATAKTLALSSSLLNLLFAASSLGCRGGPGDAGGHSAPPEPPVAALASAEPIPGQTPSASAALGAPAPSAAAVASAAPVEIHVEDFPAEDGFVVRGGKGAGQAVLFGGICAQPQGYIDAIKIAASRRVQLVALRGDKPCSGEFRGWTFDLDRLSARIDRTFRALGMGEARDVLLIGYSQGASVAELLAAREPDKYTRVVLMAKPRKPDPWHFRQTKAVATMAGTRDAQEAMVSGSRALSAAGVRSRYFPLPGAAHGYMGDDPEGTFEKVFAWLYQEPAL